MQSFLIVVLVCISFKANDFKHLSLCLFAIHVSSLVKYLLNLLTNLFLTELFYCLILRVLYIL